MLLIFIAFQSAHAQVAQEISLPFQTVNEVQQRLTVLGNELYKINDQRGLFTQIYISTNQAILLKITEGKFKNPEWVKNLLIAFSNLYRESLYQDLIGSYEKEPLVWKVQFDAIRSGKTTAGMDLFLGMRAHIMRDMVLALLTVNTHFDSVSMYEDYQAISEIIKSDMQDLWSVYREYDHHFQLMPKIIEQKLMFNWVKNARLQTWYRAKIAASITTSKKREFYLKQIDHQVANGSLKYRLLNFIVR